MRRFVQFGISFLVIIYEVKEILWIKYQIKKIFLMNTNIQFCKYLITLVILINIMKRIMLINTVSYIFVIAILIFNAIQI